MLRKPSEAGKKMTTNVFQGWPGLPWRPVEKTSHSKMTASAGTIGQFPSETSTSRASGTLSQRIPAETILSNAVAERVNCLRDSGTLAKPLCEGTL